jgi:hypothetical protein
LFAYIGTSDEKGPMGTTAFLVGLALAPILVLLLLGWSFFVRRYNDRVLANSPCKACGSRLGAECIPPARAKWRVEVKGMRQRRETGLKWSNLELHCPHCGEVNSERDLYTAWKQR